MAFTSMLSSGNATAKTARTAPTFRESPVPTFTFIASSFCRFTWNHAFGPRVSEHPVAQLRAWFSFQPVAPTIKNTAATLQNAVLPAIARGRNANPMTTSAPYAGFLLLICAMCIPFSILLPNARDKARRNTVPLHRFVIGIRRVQSA